MENVGASFRSRGRRRRRSAAFAPDWGGNGRASIPPEGKNSGLSRPLNTGGKARQNISPRTHEGGRGHFWIGRLNFEPSAAEIWEMAGKRCTDSQMAASPSGTYPNRIGVRAWILTAPGPSAAYIRAEHCRLSHLWPHGPNMQERPFTRTTGASRKGGERMLELAKEFLVILAGVLAGERIGRWIDKRFKK